MEFFNPHLYDLANPELWVANLDGTELKQLTRTKQTESSPTWSPTR